MTNEEAIKWIKQIQIVGYEERLLNHKEALDMAIKALEQEPCEDCISREEVCDYIAEFVNHEYATDREREMVSNMVTGIKHMSSIQPKAKAGHWDWVQYDSNSELGNFHCSECRFIPASFNMAKKHLNYCPNCGAKMEDIE